MKFEWEEDKNIINKERHKISFETAESGQKPTEEQLKEVEEAKKSCQF